MCINVMRLLSILGTTQQVKNAEADTNQQNNQTIEKSEQNPAELGASNLEVTEQNKSGQV